MSSAKYSIFLVIFTINFVLLELIRNLLIKVEKYDDAVTSQTKYLQNISNAIGEGKKHLQSLDNRGIFQSDDEVGHFFEQMKKVQQELDDYMLPENYGKTT